jgi:ABC-type glycerol-3-phosphate transport system permease component
MIRPGKLAARTRRFSRVRAAGAVLIAALCLLPLAWTSLTSLGLRTALPAAGQAPQLPTLEHFAELGLAEQGFWTELATSAAVAILSAAISIAAAFPAAYALARSRRSRAGSVAQVFLVLASLPLMAYVFPLAQTLRALRLLDRLPGLILAQAALLAPLAVYLLFGALLASPRDVEEAARLEGASLPRTLVRVILPMNAGIMAAVGSLVLVLDWNSYLAPLVLAGGHVRTLPLGLSDFLTSDRELEWPTAAAALIVALLPLVALFAATRLSAGALRGKARRGRC